MVGMRLSSKLIRETRKAAGLTQAELARRAGTSQPTIAAYESGDKVPTVGTLERLLRAAGTELRAVRSTGTRRSGRGLRLVKEHRREILDLAARHHAGNVRVFGSVARGEEREGSDIDLLVDLEAGSSLIDQVRLRRDLTHLLGVEVDVLSSGGLREGDPILEDSVPV